MPSEFLKPHSRGVAIFDSDTEGAEQSSDVGSESTTPGSSCIPCRARESVRQLEREDHERATSQELLFLCRMECISQMKEKIEKGDPLILGQTGPFEEDLKTLKKLWKEVTLKDLEFAARSSGKHLGTLFDMLTVKVPPAFVTIDDPIRGGDKKVKRELARELPQDSPLYTAIKGKKKFIPCEDGKNEFGDWRLNTTDWQVEVEVEMVGVGLMRNEKEDFADLVLMMVLAKFSGYATSAHAMLFMCWQKQMPYYWMDVSAACASIIALIDITYCTKVLGCSEAPPGSTCCADSALDHNFSPLVVLGVGLWFLINDVIYAFVLVRETKYAKNVLRSSKVFELLLEATTAFIAVHMAFEGWTFARRHYVQFFFLVSSCWLHLLYILLPVPVVGRTLLPMYQAVFSYESKAFLLVNLVVLAGSFQAFISLRSDINANNVDGGLLQPIADALLAQYRLNFLGDFSIDELRGEGMQIKENIISTKIGNAQQRHGVALFMIVITFIQAVLMLNLYIGILSESYSENKKKIDTEFTQFRANFMLKNLCLVRFLNNFGLERFNTFLARYEKFSGAHAVWVISPNEGESRTVQLCEKLKEEIRAHDLETLMRELGNKRKD